MDRERERRRAKYQKAKNVCDRSDAPAECSAHINALVNIFETMVGTKKKKCGEIYDSSADAERCFYKMCHIAQQCVPYGTFIQI